MEKSTFNLLTDVKTAKVSLVKRGANKRQFAIFKSESEMDPEMQELFEAVLTVEAEGEGKLEAIAKQAKLSEKAQNAVKGALRLLNAYKDEAGVGSVAGELAKLVGYVAPKKQRDKKKEEEEEKKKTAKQRDKDKEKYKYPMQKALDALPDEMREQLEPVFKAQAEAYDEEVAKAEERAQEADKRTEAVAKTLKEERDERQLQEWIAKADTDLSHYPGANSEELGAMLKQLGDTNPELAEKQFASMKAASDAIKESALLKEAGSNPAPAGSAYQKIRELTKAKIQKSEGKMTEEQAEVEIMKEHPALYEEYLKEHPAQSRPIMA